SYVASHIHIVYAHVDIAKILTGRQPVSEAFQWSGQPKNRVVADKGGAQLLHNQRIEIAHAEHSCSLVVGQAFPIEKTEAEIRLSPFFNVIAVAGQGTAHLITMLSVKRISNKRVHLRFKLSDYIVADDRLLASTPHVIHLIHPEPTAVRNMCHRATPVPAATLVDVGNLSAEVLHLAIDVQGGVYLV